MYGNNVIPFLPNYSGTDLASLDGEYLNTLIEIVALVVNDMGEENGLNFMADLFMDLDIEVVKLWIEGIQTSFAISPNDPNVMPNSIGFLIAAKTKLGGNFTIDEFMQFIIDEMRSGRL